MKKLIAAKSAGFCYGVSRAIKIAEETAKRGPCYTLGSLIHNKAVTGMLSGKGVHEAGGIEEIPEGSTVIIRTHGASPDEYEALVRKGCTIVDATCPDVAKIHRLVKDISARGRVTVIIGDEDHPEVRAIRGWSGRSVTVKDAQEAQRKLSALVPDPLTPLSVVQQTTESREAVQNCCNFFKKQYTNTEYFDTICNATFRRQEEARVLADCVQAVIVIGDKTSANTRRLAEICAERCAVVIHAENVNDLPMSKLADFGTIGVTAGASAPEWIIKEVCDKMTEGMDAMENFDEKVPDTEEMTPQGAEVVIDPAVSEPVEARETITPEAAAEVTAGDETAETFDQMLEKNMRTLTTGQKITGIVASISAAEVTVDLGTKQSGYIPIAELTDDPDVKPEDIVQVGSEIETYVMRVNDVEGTVMLSKKRLDTVKYWEMIEKAKDDKEVVEGTVIEDNKGGIVVSVKGIRVFVPASQSGLPKGAEMSSLIKTKQKLKITEVNRARRRVVGSIRAVQYSQRKNASEATWAEIEVGKKYRGVVKSLTSYGAFIDIGGVDGMAHVSELSWKRVRNPADILSVGDEIDVYVISFDKEAKRISLGCKSASENPWTKFTNTYNIGDVISVKIVKLMPFGAFAEILPGVDGLIHVSQISADRRIGKPDEVLSEGQTVNVKITNIDFDKKKVSLSIRALAFEPAPSEELKSARGEDAVVYDTETAAAQEDSSAE
ncbi:MAG: bifunctional 4-hydroxy-3-methylbut-2-enyl diphosphate reductase/30S ribosomal protein S1 [Clostridiales bacterium]|nr:bifunctional 4-hydroxy-3-methylbut-2-enyl diphosphate reductase/30S ribosomal protein S1 [Clostridiales bacterium]